MAARAAGFRVPFKASAIAAYCGNNQQFNGLALLFSLHSPLFLQQNSVVRGKFTISPLKCSAKSTSFRLKGLASSPALQEHMPGS